MTKHKGKSGLIDVKELLRRDKDFLRAALQALAQAALVLVNTSVWNPSGAYATQGGCPVSTEAGRATCDFGH